MTKRLLLACLVVGAVPVASLAVSSQTPAPSPTKVDKASAYYHYSLGHLYAELANAYGNKGDFLDKAIDNYREAMKADPGVGFLADELSDLYIQAGRLREAVLDAQSALRDNPDDINARRILARIYTRLIGDSRQQRVNEDMVKKAIEQYSKIAEKVPDDKQVWLLLGRLYKLDHNSVEAENAYKKLLELDPDNEDALVGLAMVYSDLGDHSRAAEMLRRVVGKNPSVRTLTFLAGTYEQMHDYKLAAETYRRALELSPNNTELKRALAQNLLMGDQEDDALEVFQQLAAEDAKDYRAQLRLSQIYRQRREYDKARTALDKAREIAPDSLEVQYQNVNLLEAEGKISEAIEALKEILASTKKESYSTGERGNRSVFLERLGLLYRATEQYEEAVSVFRELVKLNPELDARAAAQIADTYRQAKQFGRAFEEIEKAYQKYPKDRMIGIVRATILADMGRSGEAVAAIQAVMAGQTNRDSYLTLAQVYDRAKRYDLMAEALDEAEKLSKSDQERADVLFMKGARYERLKQYGKAEQAFRQVLQLTPDNASAMNYLGYMFAERNIRLKEALQLISKALELEPGNGAYLDSLGWVYYRMERLQEAESCLLQAVQKISKDPVIHDHLGDAYFRQGKLREAIAHWQISLKEWERTAASERDPEEIAKVHKKLEGAEVRLAKESAALPEK